LPIRGFMSNISGMSQLHDYEKSPPETLLTASTWQMAFDTPWKAVNELERRLLIPLARLQFAWARVQWGRGWKFYGLPIIQKHRRSVMLVGAHLELRSTARSNPLGPSRPVIFSTRRADARLQIGDYFGMTGGSIVCEQLIIIGNRVTVGANTIITDTDFHPLNPQMRQRAPLNGATAPVVIEDDVFIGMNSLILKGVTIGRDSVIGAGSVVTHNIPAGVVAAGNPARVIRDL
jgi:acetyltransferase-like isoleucine patch superfamily enzyme